MKTPPAENDSPPNDPLSHGALAVRSLLERHGVLKHRHSAFVGEFFELSRAAAHQRVSKSTAWTLEELAALGEHFGESLVSVVGGQARTDGICATLRTDEAQVKCRIWLREGNAPSRHDAFVAVEQGGAYTVMPVTAAGSAGILRLARIEIDQTADAQRRIAVLDPGTGLRASMCAQLTGEGLDAVGFASADTLLAALKTSVFDGYVIDWPLRKGEAVPLLLAIRAQTPTAALVLLSDKMRGSKAQLVELVAVLKTYKAQYFEKPAQLPLIVSALENTLAS